MKVPFEGVNGKQNHCQKSPVAYRMGKNTLRNGGSHLAVTIAGGEARPAAIRNR